MAEDEPPRTKGPDMSNPLDAAHCWALAENTSSSTAAYEHYQEARQIIVTIGGTYASLDSIGATQGPRPADEPMTGHIVDPAGWYLGTCEHCDGNIQRRATGGPWMHTWNGFRGCYPLRTWDTYVVATPRSHPEEQS